MAICCPRPCSRYGRAARPYAHANATRTGLLATPCRPRVGTARLRLYTRGMRRRRASPAAESGSASPFLPHRSLKNYQSNRRRKRKSGRKSGRESVWSHVLDFRDAAERSGQLRENRAAQLASRARSEFERELLRRTLSRDDVADALVTAQDSVRRGECSPRTAAARVLDVVGEPV